MSQHFALLPALTALVLGLSACEKVRAYEPVAVREPIPLEYGDLVGVIPGEAPGWVRMYFQRPDKSIVVVVVNGERGYMDHRIIDFPRH